MIKYDRKEFGLLFVLLLIAITTGIVAVTYSMFFSSTKTDDSVKVANWLIKVNGSDVTTSSHIFTFDEFVFDNNDDVSDGMFAPGVSVRLPISIDVSDCDVAVDYEITLDDDYVSLNDAIVLENVPIKGTIPLNSDIVNIDNLRLTWKDIEGNEEVDTNFANKVDELKIPVSIKLTQHIDKK